MPAIRLIAGLAVAMAIGSVAPSYSADAPVPPPPATADGPSQTASPPVAPPQADVAAHPLGAQPASKEDPAQSVAKQDATAPITSVSKPPSVTVIDSVDAHGILGRDVRSPANENMGRISDVIVDRAGQVRAAVIDFGGFLGVGSRKIVVEWNALHFWNVADKTASITLELTREQVRAAPEYKDDTPIVVLGASGALSPLRFQPLTMQER
jgi:hypothetical protein